FYQIWLQATDASGAATQFWWTTVVVGRDTTSIYSYDHKNELLGVGVSSGSWDVSCGGPNICYEYYGGTIRTASYSYDDRGNRLTRSQVPTGATAPVNTTYQYDMADRLISATSGGATSYQSNA